MDGDAHQKDDSFLVVDLVVNQTADIAMCCQLTEHQNLRVDLNSTYSD